MAKEKKNKDLFKDLLSFFTKEEMEEGLKELTQEEKTEKEKLEDKDTLTELEELRLFKASIEEKKKELEEKQKQEKQEAEKKENDMTQEEMKELEELKAYKAQKEAEEKAAELSKTLSEYGYDEKQIETLSKLIDVDKLEEGALDVLKDNVFQVQNNTMVDPSLSDESSVGDKEDMKAIFKKAYEEA